MNFDRYIAVIKKKSDPKPKKRVPGRKKHLPARFGPLPHVKKSTKFMSKNNVKVLDWPGNFSDLDPIENLWFIIKSHSLTKDCARKRMLTEAITEVWYSNEKIAEKCEKSVELLTKIKLLNC